MQRCKASFTLLKIEKEDLIFISFYISFLKARDIKLIGTKFHVMELLKRNKKISYSNLFCHLMELYIPLSYQYNYLDMYLIKYYHLYYIVLYSSHYD